MNRRMVVAVGVASLLHGALALSLTQVPRYVRKGPRWLEVEVRRKEPPRPIAQAPRPEPPKPEPPPPEPPKPKAKKPRPIPEAPMPNETREPPKEPPKEPVKPVFGVSQASTTGESSFAVPVGNTTMTDPKNRATGPVQPLPPAPPAARPAPVFRPASESEVDRYPKFEEGSCDARYPDGEAKQAGIEGETVLRVEIDENGRVHSARVIKGVGHGLDELAVKLLRTKCKFGPAYNKAGKPIPFAITHYVTWKLD